MKRKINMIFLLGMLLLPTLASASIVVDGQSLDPSVVAAGDEVLLTVNFHDEGEQAYSMSNQEAYRLEATLLPGDTVTGEHVTILDGTGTIGHLFIGQTWSETYRLKVHEDAPVGTYRFKLSFQYSKDGQPTGAAQIVDIMMTVTKEGIILNLANIVTTPNEVRPGDNYVVLETYLENSGRKNAKAVEMTLELPEGFTAPYASNNRVYVGYLAATEQQAMTTHFSVDEDVAPGIYELGATISYRDESDNSHQKRVSIPFMVREKPVLVVTSSEGSIKAGEKGSLRITVKNTGTEEAEAVDIRLLRESGQPFAFEARSDYLGTLAPGEEAQAIFTIEAESGAAEKEHSFTALIRAKGDTEKGDDNIYSFSREATILVEGKKTNWLLWAGILLLLIGMAVFIATRRGRK